MIFEARSVSRRWIRVTFEANLVRNVASSTAESPPPTTAISWPRKKNPSHVAHVDRPWPSSRFSASRPSIRLCAPVETMTASAVNSSSRTQTLNGRSLKSTAVTFSVRNSAPKRSACSRNLHHQLRAHDAVGEAGEVLDLGGEHQLPAGLIAGARRLALDDERREVGAGGVDGRGQAGGAGADDDDVMVAHAWSSTYRLRIATNRRAPGSRP